MVDHCAKGSDFLNASNPQKIGKTITHDSYVDDTEPSQPREFRPDSDIIAPKEMTRVEGYLSLICVSLNILP
jgi:hypothetical protein